MRYKKTFIATISLIALYALLGFFVAPSVLKPKLVQALEQTTHRAVKLGNLRVNPFALSLDLEDFSLLDRDSATLVSFHELFLNYQLRSLFQHAYVFSELRLDTPYIAIRVLQDGKFSISDLLDQSHPDTVTHTEESIALVIDELSIRQGTIFYQDLSKPDPVVKMIDSLDFTLKNFTTKPQEGGEYEFDAVTRQNEKLHWRGDLSVTPPRSNGLIEVSNLRVYTFWDFMRDQLNFTTPSGTINFRGEYRFALSGDTTKFRLDRGRVDASDLVIADPADTLPPVTLPEVHAAGIAVVYPHTRVSIDSLLVVGGDIRTSYLADGSITLQQLLTPRPDPRDTMPSDLSFVLKTAVIKNLGFTFTDKSLEPYAPLSLSSVNLVAGNFVFGIPGATTLEGTGVLNGGGIFEVSGTLSLDPRNADLDIRVAKSPLPALQPYITRYSRAQLRAGTYSVQGKLSYAVQRKTMALSFRGGFTSDGGRIDDPVLKEDLTRWDHLEIRKVDYRSNPASLSVAEIVATRPYARVVVSPDRSTTIQHVMAQPADTAANPVRDTSKTARLLPGQRDTVNRIVTKIGTVSVVDGSMNFSDLSLSPNFTIGVQQLNGSIKGLSSEELTHADVDLEGKVDKYAPALIKGSINPLTEDAYTNIQMKFDGIELTSFTPYFSKFAGYKIEQGKLSLDLHYKLNKRFLEADNKVILNQLTLGEKVESPDATSLPVKLAIALLKDSKGVIDLDVPVSGSLDDPEFSFFPIILKAVLNLLWKIVTAPFALIGSLVGGGNGDDLQYVAFPSGSDSLMHDQYGKLETVAKGLKDRPALDLQIKGNASESVDREALAEKAVVKRMRPSGPAGLQKGDDESLLSLYTRTFQEDPGKLIPEQGTTEADRDSLIVQTAWKRLVDSVHVSEDDLRSLAQRRAASVMEYLTAKGAIDPARIFQQEVDTKVGPTDGMVRTTLTLTAQ
ncbi:MAG: DUF748 domain-containing protein [Bacteroidota bacterium]